MPDHVVRDSTDPKNTGSGISPWKGKTHLRGFSYGLGAAAIFTGALSAYFLVYYESLGSQILLRNRPQFVQAVTYPAILACALGIGYCASYLAARGRGNNGAWEAVGGSLTLLNFYSLWSSRAFLDFLSPFMPQAYLFPLQSYGFGFGIFGNLPVDLISILLVVVICSAGYFVCRQERVTTRILRVLQLGSASILPLPIYVLLFDSSEFNLHVTSFQEHYGVLQWFTNADLLVLALLMFLGSTILLARKPGRNGR